VGVYLNDDVSGSNTMSCLPSASLSNPCPASGIVLPGGTYYLAISRSANYPLDIFGNEIFNPLSSTDLVGPSSTNPFGSWDGGSFTSPDTDLVNYEIDLTGTVPEPATWLLTAGAVLALGRFRRRR
jgi:PEP-CTERM motif